MAKTFYTERDIQDLARAGIRQVEIDDDIIVTDVARERADQLGLRLVRRPAGGAAAPPAPAAPAARLGGAQSAEDLLVERVKSAVLVQLGFSVDAQFVETVVRLVLANLRS